MDPNFFDGLVIFVVVVFVVAFVWIFVGSPLPKINDCARIPTTLVVQILDDSQVILDALYNRHQNSQQSM